MSKRRGLCLILCVCVISSGCMTTISPASENSRVTPTPETTESKETTSAIQQTGVTSSTIEQLDKSYSLYQETEFYKNYGEDGGIGAYYEIFNEKGEQIDNGFSEKDVNIEMIGSYVEVAKNGGTFTRIVRYCDVTNSRISKWYTSPLAISGEYIACLETGGVLIQHIFRDDTYRKVVEIDYSSPVQVEAEFIDNGTQLKIVYPIAPDDRKVTLIVPID